MNKETLITLYHSFFYPYLHYCITVWGNTNQIYLQRIIKLQKIAIRMISRQRKMAESTPLFTDLKLLTLKQLYVYACQLFMYKFHHCLLPDIFKDFFTYNYSLHHYQTRQHHQLYVPKRLTKYSSRIIRTTRVQLSNFLIAT